MGKSNGEGSTPTDPADVSAKPEGEEAEKEKEGEGGSEEPGDEVTSMDEGTEDEEGPEESSEDAKTEEEEKKDEEEPSNLQLAWEMLELAKVVYTKQIESGETENKAQLEERLCSSILSLAEVSIENENYTQAVDDLKSCLAKQFSLPKDSRIVAETRYQ